MTGCSGHSGKCEGTQYPRNAGLPSPLYLLQDVGLRQLFRLMLLGRVNADIHGRATEMDVTMIGLQNAGKTSLLRVLAVSASVYLSMCRHC